MENRLKKGLGRGLSSLLGDSSKAREELGWKPKITFDQLVEDMVIYGQ